ncbi:MAG: LysR family transcriptional regulator [Beijerinckiaceae bacterium]|nr:LysR family transcriptional regulator [Beijerinckiaceae bacterium]
MRFHGLDLNLLAALDALLRHQNVTRAAEELHISQSAMSNALARLRTHFEDELIAPRGRRMVPTPLAETLAQPLREILLQTTRFLKTRSAFEPRNSSRRFTVSCSDYAWAVLIPEVLKEIAALAPSIEIYYAGTSVKFEKSDIDVLIVPERFALPAHPCERLFRDGYACIVWAGNRTVEDTLSREQLLSLGHVTAYSERRTFVEEWLYSQHGKSLKVAAVAPSFTQIPQTVVGTNYLAIVPEQLAWQSAERLPLRVLPSPLDIPEMVNVLQWQAYQNEDPGLAWFRALLKRAATRLFDGP